jgi:hypothetical protein
VCPARFQAVEWRFYTLLDFDLRHGNGFDLYHWISAHRPELAKRVAFMPANADGESSAPLAALGCAVLQKPCDIVDLTRVAVPWEASADPSAS